MAFYSIRFFFYVVIKDRCDIFHRFPPWYFSNVIQHVKVLSVAHTATDFFFHLGTIKLRAWLSPWHVFLLLFFSLFLFFFSFFFCAELSDAQKSCFGLIAIKCLQHFTEWPCSSKSSYIFLKPVGKPVKNIWGLKQCFGALSSNCLKVVLTLKS